MTTAPIHSSISGLAAELDDNSCSSLSMVQSAIGRIQNQEGEGSRCFTQVYTERAQKLARASDLMREAGYVRSGIEGLPISVKDLFDVAGEVTLAGSRILRNSPKAQRNAPVIDRLLSAGAVLVGRTNMTEFAYSGLGINPHFGTPANPWDRRGRRIPGGSSSGAAVAVADGMCVGSIGTDTGGSVRIPAAFCGLTGFKPTARRISMEGTVPLSSSLDSVGFIASDVGGCAALDSVLTGSLVGPPMRLLGRRFIVPTTLVQDGLDEHVSRAFNRALERISNAGAELVECKFSELAELADINSTGGFSAVESWAWHEKWIDKDSNSYDPRVLSRILRGRDWSAGDYISLVRRRHKWQCAATKRLDGFDAMLLPTVPFIAPSMDVLTENDAAYSQANVISLRNPSVINFLDGCAISIPCHTPGEAPVGLMLAGLPMRDAWVLGLAATIEGCMKL